MAWISVHEQVVGGKLRTLAKELNCSQNEALGMLVTLWLWGINNADSEGKIIGATRADIVAIRLEDAMAVCAAAADASRKVEGCTETKEDVGVAEPKSDL